MTDDLYSFWRRAIEITGGKRSLTRDEMKALVVTEEPCAGFWRRRTIKAGPLVPVAIWKSGLGDWVAVQSGTIADAEQIWTYCAPHPVLHEAYTTRMETGRWPDEDSAVTDSLEPPPPSPSLGDNFPPPEDPAAEVQRKIDAASANAKDYVAAIKDEVTAGKAQSVRSRLLELAGEAEKEHEVEKRPVLDAGRVIDKKWLIPAKAARAVAEELRSALSAFATAQRKAAEDAARAAEQAAKAKAAADAKAAAEAAKKGQPAPKPAPAPPVPVAPTQIGGAYGRRASVRTIRVVTAIDYDKAYTAMKNHPELKDLIAKLAQRAVDKGVEVDGVTYEEREDVR